MSRTWLVTKLVDHRARRGRCAGVHSSSVIESRAFDFRDQKLGSGYSLCVSAMGGSAPVPSTIQLQVTVKTTMKAKEIRMSFTLVKRPIMHVVLGVAMAACMPGCLEQSEHDIGQLEAAQDDTLPEADETDGDLGNAAPDQLPPPEEAAIDADRLELWTGWTSEEYPPLTCNTGSVTRGVDCSGGNCDNVSLDCVSPGYATFGARSWTSYFSEENTSYRYCPAQSWLTGIACKGGECDNITLECTQITDRTPSSCTWSGYFSEEDPPFVAPTGKYIRGVQCNGGRCDNKRYYHCSM